MYFAYLTAQLICDVVLNQGSPVTNLSQRRTNSRVPFGTGLVVQSTVCIPQVCERRRPMQNSKLKTYICHICPDVMAQKYPKPQ